MIANSLLSVLHPRHKLTYFEKAKWESDWIKAATQLIRAEFDLSYDQTFASQGAELDNEVCLNYLLLSHLTTICTL